jgi:hypothetical protein
VTGRLGKSCQINKSQISFSKAQLENPKHLHQTSSELLKYLQKACFETAYSGENVKKALDKSSPKCYHSSTHYSPKISLGL